MTVAPDMPLFRQGYTALAVKVSAAALSLAMLLALARVMPSDAFGQFGFAFSLATFISVVGSFGQRALVLRYASVYAGDDDRPTLSGILRYGYRNILLGGGILCLVLAASAAFAGQDYAYLVVAGPLALVMSMAEYQAHFLRACGRMFWALSPRDILWRIVVILFAVASLGPQIDLSTAFTALALLTLSLSAIVAVQAFLAAPLRELLCSTPSKIDDGIRSGWRRTAWGLWGTSVVQSAGPNLAVVLLGLLLTPAQTGPFFSALRIAMLLSLFLMAANMAAASAIARSFAVDDRDGMQRVCTSVSRMIMLPTLAMFAIFVASGDHILRLFGDGFDSAYVPLVILSFGYVVASLSGPTTQVMETTGFERTYLRILAVTTCIALALTPVAIYLAGVVGAAIMVSANLIAVRLLCYRFIMRALGIATGVYAPASKGSSS